MNRMMIARIAEIRCVQVLRRMRNHRSRRSDAARSPISGTIPGHADEGFVRIEY